MITEAKNRHYKELLTEFMTTSPDIFWHHTSKKDNESLSAVVDSTVVTDPAVIASYNEFFQSVFSAPSQSSIKSTLSPLSHLKKRARC